MREICFSAVMICASVCRPLTIPPSLNPKIILKLVAVPVSSQRAPGVRADVDSGVELHVSIAWIGLAR